LSFNLEASELNDMWRTAAEKDVDQNIEMVDESELQEKITERFKILTEETKRLCNVPIEVDKPSNIVKLPEKEKKVINNDEKFDEIDLFNFDDFIVIDEVKVKKRGEAKNSTHVVEQF